MRLFSMFIVCLVASTTYAQTESHGFSVKDDIEMVRFSDPSGQPSDFHANDMKYSPDGNLVAIVTSRGVLVSDEIESTISLFDLNLVRDYLRGKSTVGPKPRIVTTVAMRPHHEDTMDYAPVIKDLRWSSDSRHVYFLAYSQQDVQQLRVVDVDGKGVVRTLTPSDYDVSRYDFTGKTIVFTASQAGHDVYSQGDPINRDALAITGHSLPDILFPGQMATYYPQTFRLGTIRLGETTPIVHWLPDYSVTDPPLILFIFPFKVSPDGDKLLTILPLHAVPKEWEAYEPHPDHTHWRLTQDPKLVASNYAMRPRQYGLVDLKSGTIRPLIDGPMARTLGYLGDDSTGAWSPDGRHVLVTNVFMPIGHRVGADESNALRPCEVADVDVATMSPQCVLTRAQDATAASDVESVRFVGDSSHVEARLLAHGAVAESTLNLTFRNAAWSQEAGAAESDVVRASGIDKPGRPTISIKESLNDPPTLWASDAATSVAKQIWNPNPQLASIRLGCASVYRWKDRVGREWIGGLVKPVGYEPGKRYPLVLQMYQFRENDFLTDGTDPTAFAARELASAGFVVLQIRRKPNTASEADPQIALDGYRSAVEHLVADGLADPGKVGVVGFSLTCWYALNALVKAPELFAAATIADGLDYSYMQYMLFSPGPPETHVLMERVRGGSPIGPHQQQWFKDAPGFHLDQVEAPVRLEVMKPASVLQEWEVYSSLYLQHKPVDLIYFPEGTHVHERPLERYESQQGNIDWMRYWLQRYKDPDPLKRAQYERWDRIINSLHQK